MSFSSLNEASTIHFLFLIFKELWSALLPNNSDKAPSIIDFPEPVSPVMILRPLEKLTSKSSINAKFLTDNDNNKTCNWNINIGPLRHLINYFVN